MHDRINERRVKCAYNSKEDPFYLCQRFTEVQNNPVYQQIVDLQEKIKWLQRNNDPWNVAVKNLLEENESLFSADIRTTLMPPSLKLPDLKYNGMRGLAEYLETYKSWMELNLKLNDFQFWAVVINLTGIARL